MIQTVQSVSQAFLSGTGKDLTLNEKPEAEDNMTLMLSVLDNLNNLCEKLTNPDYTLKTKFIDQQTNHNNKGEITSALRSRRLCFAEPFNLMSPNRLN
ncbi:MAG: hypothetical protein LBI04_11365 [Treponema sp.]|jgi:hypothetical protein|nr:hypothetical protein [Treponema sp.]